MIAPDGPTRHPEHGGGQPGGCAACVDDLQTLLAVAEKQTLRRQK